MVSVELDGICTKTPVIYRMVIFHFVLHLLHSVTNLYTSGKVSVMQENDNHSLLDGNRLLLPLS
jgi:hypothetical protein